MDLDAGESEPRDGQNDSVEPTWQSVGRAAKVLDVHFGHFEGLLLDFGRPFRFQFDLPPIDSKFSYTGNDWTRAFTWRTIVAMASSTWRSK